MSLETVAYSLALIALAFLLGCLIWLDALGAAPAPERSPHPGMEVLNVAAYTPYPSCLCSYLRGLEIRMWAVENGLTHHIKEGDWIHSALLGVAVQVQEFRVQGVSRRAQQLYDWQGHLWIPPVWVGRLFPIMKRIPLVSAETRWGWLEKISY